MNLINEFFGDFKKTPKKYTTILGGSLLLCSLGTIGLVGSMSPYYMSYLREKAHQTNVRYSQAIYLQALQSFCIGISATLGGFIKYKYNASIKLLAVAGACLHGLGLFLTMFTLNTTFVVMALTIGCMYGFGFGLAYIVPLSMAMKWWGKAKGKSTAIMVIGFSIGGFVFPEFVTNYINPDNLSPDKPYSDDHPNEKYYSNEAILNRVPYAFLIMSIITAVLAGLGLLLMYDKPDNSTEGGDDETPVLINEEKPAEDQKPTLTLIEAVKRPEIYMLCIMSSFYYIGPTNFDIYYKSFGQRFIQNDKFLTAINAASSIFNMFARLFWGWVIDKYSFKIVFLTTNTASMAFLFTVALTEYIGNEWIYAIWVFGINFLQVCVLMIMPIVYVKVFGQQNLLLIHGLGAIIGLPSILITVVTSPLILDNFGYFALFSTSCIYSTIAWVVAAFFNVKNSVGNDV